VLTCQSDCAALESITSETEKPRVKTTEVARDAFIG
jgi:hypothetical protein